MTRKEPIGSTEHDASYWEEMVDWTVPVDMANPDSDSFTTLINGYCYQCKRGEVVSVPRYVVEQYNQQQLQYLSQIRKQKELANVKLGET